MSKRPISGCDSLLTRSSLPVCDACSAQLQCTEAYAQLQCTEAYAQPQCTEAYAQPQCTEACAGLKREERTAEVYDLLEQQMHLLGATAVEDKLQDNVPETISQLQSAGTLV